MKIRPGELCPCGPPGREASAHLRDPFLLLSLLSERPAPHDHAVRQPERKPLLATNSYRCLCSFLGHVRFPVVLIEHGSKVERPGEADRVRQLLGKSEGLRASLQRLAWV